MKKNLTFQLALIAILFTPSFLFGQVNPADSIQITANYKNIAIPNVLGQLAQDLNIQFYYQADELPKRTINRNFQKAPLSEVLNDLFRETSLGYMFYRDYAIIIAPQGVINESFSSNYYQALEEAQNSEDSRSAKKRKIIIGNVAQMNPSGKAVVKGTIKDAQSEEPIIGATIFFAELNSGSATDFDGNFEAEVPVGEYEVTVQYIGYEDVRKKIEVYSDGEMSFEMFKSAINLEEVIVRAQAADANVENVQIGVTTLDVKDIKKLPALFGEADVVRTLLLNPGVSTVGEGATGFNVRGGSVDQNLVIQDEGFIFNASHALGFFSTFNPDLIRGVDLYKGNIPAQYGGRLASVLDVQMRDGNFEEFKIKGGAGPVSSRISVEGPVINGKSSFLAGFRSTYADWLLNLINVEEVKKSSAFFYDANLRYTHRANDKNTFILSGYASSDDFTYNEEFGFSYQTLMGQFIYNRTVSDVAYNKFSLVASSYENTQTDLGELTGAALDNKFSYIKFKDKFTFSPQKELTLDLGVSAIYYITEPGEINPLGDLSQVVSSRLEQEKGLESAAFVNASYEISSALEVSGGLRFALYNFLGPKTVNQYAGDDNSSLENLIGSEELSGSIASYNSLEPRVSLRYRLGKGTSFKAGYSRTAQFINQIFNTDTPTPTSQYQLATKYIKPQRSHNASIGFFKNFKDNLWETSAEVFARDIDQTFDYKDFAELNVNPFLETEIINGVGRAAGVELSIKKNRGTVNGFLSYTYSRTELQIEGINKGDWYPSNFDKPHDLSLVLNYNPNQRHTVTASFNYGSGRPATPPLGNYETERGLIVPIYSERNQVRIPAYHRLDLAYTIGRSYKKTNKFKTSWTISIYNVYGRKNAFSVFYTQAAFQRPQANKLAILGSAFPALTFNLEIL
ncbi:MAG: carboxypeptidase-like regulatory domain-containing protein [Saprospiraceae bacterium]